MDALENRQAQAGTSNYRRTTAGSLVATYVREEGASESKANDFPGEYKQAMEHPSQLDLLRPGVLPEQDVDGLPELLLNQGGVPLTGLLWALQEQERRGVFFVELLEKAGVITEKAVTELIVRHRRIPYLDLSGYTIGKSALALVPLEFCKKHRLMPVDKLGRSLTVAMVNPLNYRSVGALHSILENYRVQRIACSNKDFQEVYERYANGHTAWQRLPGSTASLLAV